MSQFVFRVSCNSREDQWFSGADEAERSAQDALGRGEEVTIAPVRVPETGEDFIRALYAFKSRVTVTFATDGPAYDSVTSSLHYDLEEGFRLLSFQPK